MKYVTAFLYSFMYHVNLIESSSRGFRYLMNLMPSKYWKIQITKVFRWCLPMQPTMDQLISNLVQKFLHSILKVCRNYQCMFLYKIDDNGNYFIFQNIIMLFIMKICYIELKLYCNNVKLDHFHNLVYVVAVSLYGRR